MVVTAVECAQRRLRFVGELVVKHVDHQRRRALREGGGGGLARRHLLNGTYRNIKINESIKKYKRI